LNAAGSGVLFRLDTSVGRARGYLIIENFERKPLADIVARWDRALRRD
jgi:hypothetical protein